MFAVLAPEEVAETGEKDYTERDTNTDANFGCIVAIVL